MKKTKKKPKSADVTGKTRDPAIQNLPAPTSPHGAALRSALGPVILERALDPARVQAAIDTLRDVEASYVAECAKIPDGGEMPQDLVAIAAFADSASSSLDRVYKAFTAVAEKLRVTKGKFTPGRFQVFFALQEGKRSVAWKEEATKQAAEVARLSGDTFDAKAYQSNVLKLTPASPSTHKAEIREQG